MFSFLRQILLSEPSHCTLAGAALGQFFLDHCGSKFDERER